MRTMDEKLRHFEQVVVSHAKQDRDTLLQEISQRTEQALQETRARYEEVAKERHRKGLEEAKKEARSVVSEAKNKGQTELVSKRNEIIDEVFDKLQEKLRGYVETPEYEAFLVRKLSEALANAAGHLDERQSAVEVQLSQKDYTARKELVLETARKIFPGMTPSLVVCEEDILGGCRVALPEYGRIIDNSILSAMRQEKESFLSWSNLSLT